MTERAVRVVVSVLAAAAVLATAGCGPDPSSTTVDTGRTDTGGTDTGGTDNSDRTDDPGQVADAGCSSRYPTHRSVVTDDGQVVPGLYECTNLLQTQVVNTSDTVWVLQPSTYYWSADADAAESATVQLFRLGLRGWHDTRLTIEPGVRANLPVPFNRVRLTHDLEHQMAWESASLMVETAKKKALAAVRRLIVSGSKTREAAVTCVENGYAAGKTLAQEPSNDDLAGRLEAALGLAGNYTACANAIDEAARESPTPREAITAEDLAAVTRETTWEKQTGRVLEEASILLRVAGHRG